MLQVPLHENLLMLASSDAPDIPTAPEAVTVAASGPTDAPSGGVPTILVCVCSHTESAVTFTYIAQTSRHRGV